MKNSPKATKGKITGISVRMATLDGFHRVVLYQPIRPVIRFEKLPKGFRDEAFLLNDSKSKKMEK
jgi:hypothetical protein